MSCTDPACIRTPMTLSSRLYSSATMNPRTSRYQATLAWRSLAVRKGVMFCSSSLSVMVFSFPGRIYRDREPHGLSQR